MSTYSGKKVPHMVQSTMDRQMEFACEVGLSGSATGLSASLIYATDMHTTVSGTSPGKVTVTILPQYAFPRMVGWTAQLHPTAQVPDLSKAYQLVAGPYVYPSGSQTSPTGSNAYALPSNSAVAGGAQFVFQITSGTVTPLAADPIQAGQLPGQPAYTLSIKATFKNRGRDGI